ncbi:MAG: alpha/beta hydrolase [Hespellia sp.]|nr:alpha/beta hydrolase [Hespellia sp.]
MKFTPCPGYENHLMSYLKTDTDEVRAAKKAQGADMMFYELPEGMTMKDRQIPGTEEGTEMTLRFYVPAGLPEKAPIIMDFHGGGWVGGNLDIDNARCIALARMTPAIVIGVDYRRASETIKAPAPMMDCYTAYMWAYNHAEEFGGDPERMGLHGTSAGGNFAAALALYLRDTNGPRPALAAMVCPQFSCNMAEFVSYHQMSPYIMAPENKAISPEAIYTGAYNGYRPSYYALPSECPDVEGVCPHCIVTAEYDTFRDDGVQYAVRLLNAGVPCELHVEPRVGHGFNTVHHPFTDLVNETICFSFRREFRML